MILHWIMRKHKLKKKEAYKNIYNLAHAYLSSLISFYFSHLPPPFSSCSSSCNEFQFLSHSSLSVIILHPYQKQIHPVHHPLLACPLACQLTFGGSISMSFFSTRCSLSSFPLTRFHVPTVSWEPSLEHLICVFVKFLVCHTDKTSGTWA